VASAAAEHWLRSYANVGFGRAPEGQVVAQLRHGHRQTRIQKGAAPCSLDLNLPDPSHEISGGGREGVGKSADRFLAIEY
jgi:hypothetical protein